MKIKTTLRIVLFLIIILAIGSFAWDLVVKVNSQGDQCEPRIEDKNPGATCPNNDVHMWTIIVLYLSLGTALCVSSCFLISRMNHLYQKELRSSKWRLILVLAAFTFSFLVKVVYDSIYEEKLRFTDVNGWYLFGYSFLHVLSENAPLLLLYYYHARQAFLSLKSQTAID